VPAEQPAAGEVPVPDAAAAALSPADWPVGRLLATAARLLQNAFDADLASTGLNHAGFVALHVLRDGPLSQAELARRCRVQAQTTGRTVDHLVRSGFVRRERDPADARRLVVHATEEGLTAYRAAPGRDSAHALDLLADPDGFRAELVRLVLALQRPEMGRRAPRRDGPGISSTA
jgi:DNA-binding MarR family transcriptional regulator